MSDFWAIEGPNLLRSTTIDAIARAAVANSERIAVRGDSENLSYAQLWEDAERIAAYLQRAGCGPETIVGALFERSPAMVTGILGILLSGAAYVPLEPSYPAEHLSYLVESAGVRLALTDERLCPLALQLAVDSVSIDDALHSALRSGPTAPPSSALAYVIFTSGSTGRPKGVAIEHAALVNRLDWMRRTLSLDGDDVFLQKTPFSFDVSVWELLLPLMCGASVVIVAPGRHADAAYIRDVIERERVTITHFVPSMLARFCDVLAEGACPSLRTVVASGEALSPALANRFMALHPAKLYNLYGPTEAAIDVTYWRCQGGADVVPIGHPIDNVEVFIVDERLHEAAPGSSGEIAIAGVCLARGYVGQLEHTAERFVSALRRDGRSMRTYRTGDAGVVGDDGAILFQGRLDRQIKLRGYRIEPGEIETALLALPSVDQAVVLVEPTARGPALVAYVASHTESASAPRVLREALAVRLPAFMLPARITVVSELPVTPNGKVDRAALTGLTS